MISMRKLNADEIECRVAQVTAKGCSLLLYKTARVDRAILDEMYTACGWQNDFKVIDGKMYGGIGISRVTNENVEWIWKWDCGTESNTEAEKGQASDCFKRAGFKWGIGVELYTAPFIFVQCETIKNQNGKYNLANPYVKYKVTEIGYSDKGDINKLVIVDDKGNMVYKLGSKVVKKEPEVNPDLDIIEGLKACDTLANLVRYKDSYKDKVKDVQGFKTEYAKMYKKLEAKENK